MNTKFARRSIQAVSAIAVTVTVLVSPTVALHGADSVPVGAITNFGPDLQTTAGGVCRHRDGTPGDLELFADGAALDQQLGLPSPTALYYADGMQFDMNGNLYLMANRADEVDVLSPRAHLIHRYAGAGVNAMSFNASPIFRGRQLFMTNVSAVDGGVNSKVSVLRAPYPGISLQ